MKKNRGLYHQHKEKLTKTELEVLHLISDEFMTPKKVAIRRQTTIKAVYKIIAKLKKKGHLDKGLKKGYKSDPTTTPITPKNQIRLHGLQVKFQILFKDHRYNKLLTKANLIDIDGTTIKMFKDSIIMYLNKSFYSQDIEKCTEESISYINRLAKIVENDINVIITKPRKQNIKVLMAHYSEINNEFAQDLNVKSERIQIYTREDNKLWFTIDNSFNLDEAECLHPQTNYEDMEKVKEHFNYIRDKKNPSIKEMMKNQNMIINILTNLAEENLSTAKGLNSVVKYLESQLPKEKEVQLEKKYVRPSYIN